MVDEPRLHLHCHTNVAPSHRLTPAHVRFDAQSLTQISLFSIYYNAPMSEQSVNVCIFALWRNYSAHDITDQEKRLRSDPANPIAHCISVSARQLKFIRFHTLFPTKIGLVRDFLRTHLAFMRLYTCDTIADQATKSTPNKLVHLLRTRTIYRWRQLRDTSLFLKRRSNLGPRCAGLQIKRNFDLVAALGFVCESEVRLIPLFGFQSDAPFCEGGVSVRRMLKSVLPRYFVPASSPVED